MGIKAQELIDGCFAKASLDEPLFVLRAQDRTAPKYVRQWAEDFRQAHIDAGSDGIVLAKAIMKYEEAKALAARMEQWQNRKQPD